MDAAKTVGKIFLVVGVCLLIGAALAIASAHHFITNAETTSGKIVEIVSRTSSDSHGREVHSYYPVIQFTTHAGAPITYKSFSTVSKTARVGEMIEVNYLPDNPQKVQSSTSFFDLWGGALVMGILGVAFTGVGSLVFWLGARESINEKNAQRYSKEVRAKIQGVVKNKSVIINGQFPFVIQAQWLNPHTNQIHIFKSKNFWYDPSQFLKNDIVVRMDGSNVKKYWMDVSFLPIDG